MGVCVCMCGGRGGAQVCDNGVWVGGDEGVTGVFGRGLRQRVEGRWVDREGKLKNTNMSEKPHENEENRWQTVKIYSKNYISTSCDGRENVRYLHRTLRGPDNKTILIIILILEKKKEKNTMKPVENGGPSLDSLHIPVTKGKSLMGLGRDREWEQKKGRKT